MVKAICAESGIEGKSNHSFRVAGATRMFTAGIPQKIIQQRTCHRLLKALREYEGPTEEQLREVSGLISGVEKKSADICNGKERASEAVSSLSSISGNMTNCTFNLYPMGSRTAESASLRMRWAPAQSRTTP